MQKRTEGSSEFGASNFTQISDYKIGKHLGAGNYASVRQAIHKPTGMLLAIKIYDRYKLADQQRKRAVLREITHLKKLQHYNLSCLYDVIESPSQVYLILEYVHGQTLSSYLKMTVLDRKSECLQEAEAARIVKQVL